MILLDCGNTALKWQQWQEDRLLASGGLAYDDGWLKRLDQQMQQWGKQSVYLTSVLDDERQLALEQCLGRYQQSFTRFRSAASELGVTSAYRDPGSLGDDRWMALLAAHELAPQGSLIIDAGSATTLDLMSADGQHQGGAIIPGTRTSQDHFREIFSYLDLSQLQADASRPPGCSTPQAIHIDYQQDPLDILVNLLTQWRELLPPEAVLLLAGGDANRVENRLAMPLRRVPDLVFKGMRRLLTAGNKSA